MTAQLEDFVQSALDAMDAPKTEINSGAGVWRAELPESAARFLGRTQHDLLYTFDLDRWEEGTRLECLTRLSPLVQRLRAYALGLGAVAAAHVRESSSSGEYQPYLFARFYANFSTGRVRTQARWLGVNLTNNAFVNLKGDPITSLDLVEGPPAGEEMPAPETLERALTRLADQWNRATAQDTRELQSAVERRYRLEATEILTAKQGGDRERSWKRLQDRLQISVECSLDMALVLWMSSR